MERLVLRMLRSKMESRQDHSSELPPEMQEDGIDLEDRSKIFRGGRRRLTTLVYRILNALSS